MDSVKLVLALLLGIPMAFAMLCLGISMLIMALNELRKGK